MSHGFCGPLFTFKYVSFSFPEYTSPLLTFNMKMITISVNEKEILMKASLNRNRSQLFMFIVK